MKKYNNDFMEKYNNDIKGMLIYLIKNFKFKVASISKLTGIEVDKLEKLINGKVELLELSLPIEQLSTLTRIVSMLNDGISSVDDDARVKSIIEHLIYNLEINLETIAIYSEVNIDDIKSFMNDTDSISYEKKYKLATKSLFMHFLFKKSLNDK